MHKIISVIKVLFKTTAKKYPVFFILKILRMIVTTVMPFIALFISPLIVDEIIGERNLQRLIVLAVILVGGEALCQISNDMLTNFINRYSTRLDNLFSLEIGKHVIINLDCTVGHDAILHDFVTLYPSVNVSGISEIGRCTELGTGAQIIQAKKIGESTIIGAGAVVVKDIPAKCTAVGSPAKPIKFFE